MLVAVVVAVAGDVVVPEGAAGDVAGEAVASP